MDFDDGTKEVIGCFFEVYNTLGAGFLENVYEEAMAIELGDRGIEFGRQVKLDICYKGRKCKEYVVDLLVGEVIVEIKAKKELGKFDEAQVINYLKATGKKVGLLVNFGGEDKVEFKRLVY